MRHKRPIKLDDTGFEYLIVMIFLLVVILIIGVAFFITGQHKSINQNNKSAGTTVERQAETSQYPKTPQALVQAVYGQGTATGGPYGEGSQEAIYGTGLNDASYFTASEYTSLKNSPEGTFMPYCVDGSPFTTITSTTIASGDNTATVKVLETPKTPLPSPDPTVIDITVTTTLHPLQISNISCPYIAVTTAG